MQSGWQLERDETSLNWNSIGSELPLPWGEGWGEGVRSQK